MEVRGGYMAKSIKSIYFESNLLIEAENLNLDINSLCNEAIRLALNSENDETGLELKKKAEASKDEQVLIRCSLLRNSRAGREKWAKVVTAYARKYNLSIEEVLRKYE